MAAPTPGSSTAVPATAPDLRQLVVAGGLKFVLGFEDAREFMDGLPPPTRIPRAPAWLLGVVGQGGWAVPVLDIQAWAQRAMPRLPGAGGLSHLKALRLRDGVDAWAMCLSQAPVVVNMAQAQTLDLRLDLPLSTSAQYGQLMPHAVRAWTWPEHGLALQLRWGDVASTLKQELTAHALGTH